MSFFHHNRFFFRESYWLLQKFLFWKTSFLDFSDNWLICFSSSLIFLSFSSFQSIEQEERRSAVTRSIGNIFFINNYLFVIRLIVSLIKISFSLGGDVAIKSARETSHDSLIFGRPFFRNRCLFLSRNQMKRNAPIRLFPSEKGWSLIIK